MRQDHFRAMQRARRLRGDLKSTSCRTPRNAVLHGDSFRSLGHLCDDSVDLVLTDPPYGIKWRNRHGQGIHGDDQVRASWLRDAYRVLREGRALYVFTRWDVYPQWKQAIEDAGFGVKQLLVWRKNTGGQGDLKGTYAPDGEFILFATKGRHTFSSGRRLNQVLLYDNPPSALKHHPHQKPTLLLGDLIQQSSRVGDLVLDPFLGSGSTAVAAKQQGRDYLGYEVDAGHHRVCLSRLREETQAGSDTQSKKVNA